MSGEGGRLLETAPARPWYARPLTAIIVVGVLLVAAVILITTTGKSEDPSSPLTNRQRAESFLSRISFSSTLSNTQIRYLLYPSSLEGVEFDDEVGKMIKGYRFRGITVDPDHHIIFVGTGCCCVGSGTANNCSLAYQDRVFALLDNDKDWVVDEVVVVASGLQEPTGVLYLDGDLYIMDDFHLVVVEDVYHKIVDKELGNYTILIDHPEPAIQERQTLAMSRDKSIWWSDRARCLVRAEPPYNSSSPYVCGVRNGRPAWDTYLQHLWFTDMNGFAYDSNRTWLEGLPHEELNYARAGGGFYGYPECTAASFGTCFANSTTPALLFPAHYSPIGMVTYTGAMFPELFGDLLIAFHGGRFDVIPSGPVGMVLGRVDLVSGFTGDGIQSVVAKDYEDLVKGFAGKPSYDSVWARPTNVVTAWDGSILITDDYIGAIFRVSKLT